MTHRVVYTGRHAVTAECMSESVPGRGAYGYGPGGI